MAKRRERLKARRKAVGLSQQRLAEAVGVDTSTVARWEHGETEPHPAHRLRLADALKLSAEELVRMLDEPETLGGLGASGPTDATGELSPMMSLLTSRPLSGMADRRGNYHVDERQMASQVDHLLEHYLALEAQAGGDLLYEQLADHVQRMSPMVDQAARPALLSSLALLCQMTGWLALDANRHGVARQYLCTAVLAAHQADDPAIAASALAYMSLQETYRGHAARALALIKAATDVGAGSGTSHLQTMLATRMARSLAATGDARRSLEAIDRAEATFAGAEPNEPHPVWLSYVDSREVAAQKGACYLDLGMYDAAAAAIADAVALLEQTPNRVRDRVHYLARLAKCHLRSGDLERACVAGHSALDAGSALRSSRVVERIAEFHLELAPYAHQRDVRLFRDRFSGFFRSR